jgi:hypothetical protein
MQLGALSADLTAHMQHVCDSCAVGSAVTLYLRCLAGVHSGPAWNMKRMHMVYMWISL